MYDPDIESDESNHQNLEDENPKKPKKMITKKITKSPTIKLL